MIKMLLYSDLQLYLFMNQQLLLVFDLIDT